MGQALTSSELVAKLSFTGSTAVGKVRGYIGEEEGKEEKSEREEGRRGGRKGEGRGEEGRRGEENLATHFMSLLDPDLSVR